MLQTAVAAAEAAGRADFLVHCQWLRASYLLQQGRLDDARGEARTAVATAEQLNYAGHRSHALTVLAEAALRQGDAEAAYSALAQFGSPEETGLLFDRYWVAALAADARRDTATACQDLQPICDQVQAGCYAIGITQHHRLPQLLRIALRGGETAAAAILAAGAQDLARRNPQADSLVAAGCHAQGLLEHDQGLLREAVRRAERSEATLIEAAAREDLAGFLTSEAAIEQLERAYASYVRAGAHHDTARVRAALRGLGVRKRQATVGRPQQGWGSLTASELTVVDLVARGLTNREAAAKLFLSPETIRRSVCCRSGYHVQDGEQRDRHRLGEVEHWPSLCRAMIGRMQFFCTIQSMGGPLTITDSEGKERYHARTVPDIGERLALLAADGGGQLAAIVREPMTGGFAVLIANKRMALVRFRGLVDVQCLIESPDGGLVVDGDVPNGTYELYPDADSRAEPLAEVVRKRGAGRYNVRYELGISVADGEDPVRLLATVLGIEYLCEDRRAETSDLRTGLRVFLRLIRIH